MQNERKVVELPINDVLPNRFQPRIKFDEDSINELALSIKKYGVIQPIVVRKIGNKYEIIAGERRYKASVIAGKNTIPAIVSDLTDKDSVEIALIENVQREDLTPIEKAISYKKILDMGYINQEELAIKVGKSQSAIANTLRLLNLCEEAQEALLENKISERHARSLLKIKDESKQILMLNKIINERLTVRKTDEEIEKMFNENNNSFSNSTEFNGIPTTLQNDEIVSIPDNNFVNPVNNNLPGFMNIDKIENEAKDINTPNTKPEVNMDQLLNPTGTVAPVIPESEELHSNKFFNFFDEPSDTETSSSSTEHTIPTFEVPTIPSMPQTMNIPSVPTLDISPFEVPTVSNEPQTMNIPSVPTLDISPFEVPTVPNEPQTMDMPSVPTADIPSFDVPAMSNEPQTMNIPSVPTLDISPFEVPTVPNEPQTMDMPSVPTADIPSFDVPAMSNEPQTMNIPSVPTFNVSSAPVIPTIPESEELHNNNIFNFYDESDDTETSSSSTEHTIPTFDVPAMSNEPQTMNMPSVPTLDISSFDVPAMPSEPQTMDIPSIPTEDIPSFDVPAMPNEPQTMDMPSIPTEDIPSFNVPAMPSEPQTMDIPSVPTVDIPSIDVPAMPNEPQTMDIPSVPTVDIPTFDVPAMPSEPQTMDIPSVPTVDIPTFDVPAMPNEPQTMDIPNTSMSMNEPIIPSIEVGPIPNPYINMDNNKTVELPQTQSTSTNVNIKYALEEVRNLERKLENMGYILEVDELDLPDTYQILFKIQKKSQN